MGGGEGEGSWRGEPAPVSDDPPVPFSWVVVDGISWPDGGVSDWLSGWLSTAAVAELRDCTNQVGWEVVDGVHRVPQQITPFPWSPSWPRLFVQRMSSVRFGVNLDQHRWVLLRGA